MYTFKKASHTRSNTSHQNQLWELGFSLLLLIPCHDKWMRWFPKCKYRTMINTEPKCIFEKHEVVKHVPARSCEGQYAQPHLQNRWGEFQRLHLVFVPLFTFWNPYYSHIEKKFLAQTKAKSKTTRVQCTTSSTSRHDRPKCWYWLRWGLHNSLWLPILCNIGYFTTQQYFVILFISRLNNTLQSYQAADKCGLYPIQGRVPRKQQIAKIQRKTGEIRRKKKDKLNLLQKCWHGNYFGWKRMNTMSQGTLSPTPHWYKSTLDNTHTSCKVRIIQQ